MLKKLLPFVLAIAIALGGVAYRFYVTKDYDAQLQEQVETMNALQASIDESASREVTQTHNIVSVVTGVDYKRLDKDKKIGESVIRLVTDWKNWDEYNAGREELKSTYGLTDNDAFMQTFMPVVGKGSRSDPDYNIIDANGWNMSFNRMDQYLVKIDGTKYSYLSNVVMSSTYGTSESKRTANSNAVMLYTVDADGSVSDLYGSIIK